MLTYDTEREMVIIDGTGFRGYFAGFMVFGDAPHGKEYFDGKFHLSPEGYGQYTSDFLVSLMPPWPPISDGTPFQEMAEKLEQRISELEDIQAKGLAVIDAFVKRETELANDVYHAQLDAQDWQNRYNELKADVNSGYTSIINDRDAARAEVGRLESLLYDEKQNSSDWNKKWQTDNSARWAAEQSLRDKRGQVERLSKRIEELENGVGTIYTVPGHLVAELHNLRGRVAYLTRENTDLELRNERQANRISSAKKWLDGMLDSIH